MEIEKDFEQEIIDCLDSVFSPSYSAKVGDFQKLEGADTETFSFTYFVRDKTTPLILRLYRKISNRSEREFRTLEMLSKVGLSVPKPYLWKKQSRVISRSFLIMEKIPGELLADYIFRSISTFQRMHGFHQFIQQLVDIHSFDWKLNLDSGFHINKPDIESNPYIYTENLIRFPKEMIFQHNINDLKPLVKWCEANKVKTENLSLLHGDYHMNNIIITPKKKLVVIDWADIKLGDFRHDLAFAIVATSSAGEDVLDTFTSLYQEFSRLQVTDIEFFMVLSVLHNLLRCYSALVHPHITGETELTKKMFFDTYHTYTTYLTTIVKQITGIQLSVLEKALKKR